MTGIKIIEVFQISESFETSIIPEKTGDEVEGCGPELQLAKGQDRRQKRSRSTRNHQWDTTENRI